MKIVATELYDEQNDPNETVSLANKPEHKAMLETLAKHLPPVGSDLDPKPPAKGKGQAKAASTGPTEDRGVKFDRINAAHAEKISRDIYLKSQSDPVAAADRFTRFDKDNDGLLSREEFIRAGK